MKITLKMKTTLKMKISLKMKTASLKMKTTSQLQCNYNYTYTTEGRHKSEDDLEKELKGGMPFCLSTRFVKLLAKSYA